MLRDGECVIFWRVGILALCFLCGCGTPESVRETNYLNGEAAKWIVGVTDQPEVKRAATTIAAGTEQVERKLGAPEVLPVYTPEEHEKKVAQAKSDLDSQEAVKKGISDWFQSLFVKGADLILPGLGGALLGAYFWLRKKIQFDALKKGAAPIVKIVDSHPEIQEKIAAYAGKIGAAGVVKSAVDFLKK